MSEFWQVILSSVVVSGTISATITGCINWYSKKSQKRFEKRWTVTEELYEKMVDMDIKMLSYLSPLQDSEDAKRKNEVAAAEAYKELAQFFFKKKIFIPAKTADKIDEYLTLVRKNHSDYQYAVDPYVRNMRMAAQAWDKYRTGIISEAENELESMFRKSLGMHFWERRSKKKSDNKKQQQS